MVEVFSASSLPEFDLERISYYAGDRYALFDDEGTFNCAKCEAPVYSSKDKFVPKAPLNEFLSFRSAINDSSITKEKKVNYLGMKETEIKCAKCSFHLGFLYNDGKEVGDDHANAKERHCLSSLCVNHVSKNGNEGNAKFTIEPQKVFIHLQEQEAEAKNIIANGKLVEIQQNQQNQQNEEQTTSKTQSESTDNKNTNTSNNKTQTPTLQRRDTPAIPRNFPTGKKEQPKPQTKQPSSEPKKPSTKPAPSVEKPKTKIVSTPSEPMISSDTLKMLMPLSLIIVSGAIFFYLYQSKRN